MSAESEPAPPIRIPPIAKAGKAKPPYPKPPPNQKTSYRDQRDVRREIVIGSFKVFHLNKLDPNKWIADFSVTKRQKLLHIFAFMHYYP